MLDNPVDIITFNKYWQITVEPTVEPIDVDEVKDFARIDGTDEDTFITNYIIKTVRRATERYLNRALNTQTIKLELDEWNVKRIELPRPPLISVSSIVTVDEDDSTTTYSTDNYYYVTTHEPGYVVIKNDSSVPINETRKTGGFRITYTAGYGNSASDVPIDIRTAMLLWATAIYEKRDLQGEPPPDAKELLGIYRIHNL